MIQLNQNSRHKQGQGILEYFLILLAAAIIIFMIIQVGVPAVNKLIESSYTPTPLPTSTPGPRNTIEVKDIIETGQTAEIIETEAVPANNCASTAPLEAEILRSKRIEIKISLNDQVASAVLAAAKAGLQTRYGVREGEIKEFPFTVKLKTNGSRSAVHTITWKAVTRSGAVTVILLDGTERTYSYQVRNMIVSEVKTEEKSCNP